MYVQYILPTNRTAAVFQACRLVGSVTCNSSMVADAQLLPVLHQHILKPS